MKDKIIDLLIKIANREELPKKIKYKGEIWKYSPNIQDYKNEDDSECLFSYLFKKQTNSFINDYVEIIEEEKKIEYEQIEEIIWSKYDFEKKTINSLIKNQRKLIDKVDELNEKMLMAYDSKK